MDSLLMWRFVLWGAPTIAAIFIFVANYKINQIESSKEKEQKSTNTYNISSTNQSGGFTGVVNNNIDDIEEIKALRLLEDLKKSPSKSEIIYDQLDMLAIPVKNFEKFKVLINLSNNLWNEADQKKTKTPIDQNPYQLFKNRTMPFLVKHFTEQAYKDISIDKEFELNSISYNWSNYEREYLIKTLNKVIDESSIETHHYAIKSLLIDICGYSPELLPVFEKVFGEKKIKKIKKLWTAKEWKAVDSGYQTLISNLK